MKRILIVWSALWVCSLCFHCEAASRFYTDKSSQSSQTGTVTDASHSLLRDLADCNTLGLPSNLWQPVQSQTIVPALSGRVLDQNNSYRKNIINLSFKLQIDFFKITFLMISSLRSQKHYYTLGLQKMRC